MRQDTIRDQRKSVNLKSKGLDWLIYLPGAIIISYGLWLSISLN